jgi:Lecithin retinol acyltransferase
MKYLCTCDPCDCATDGADHVAGESDLRPTKLSASLVDSPMTHSRDAARVQRRRAAPCTRAREVPEPPIGAHLITPRRGYTHHGIYAGHGSVLHYAGLARTVRFGPVEEVPLEHFANGRLVHIECRNAPALSEEDIVVRARSRLGEHRYGLLTNNCEHFSEWSRYGISRSHQVERWRGLAPLLSRRIIAGLQHRLFGLRAEDRREGALA